MIESGTVLQGRFLIEERVGEGGMGAVYRAIDQKFGTTVAIKETFYGDKELADAFEREARLLNGLHHPIFPHVSDYFSDEGGHFLVMEYIDGEDFSALLKRGELFAVEEVMRWTLDLLDGLDYLHSQDPPVIHRDIKPNNLKLTSRGNIVLLDFGMAKETSGNTLGMRSVFGYSRRYSPLEQIEGTGTDPRSDIFSLGATVHHLLVGKPPVDVLARASAIVAGRPDPLRMASEIRPDVPEPVAAIIHSSLSLNPDQRFVSARAMWSALEYALGLDLAEDNADSAPGEVETAAPMVIAPDPSDFPALAAYRAETDEVSIDEGADLGPAGLQEAGGNVPFSGERNEIASSLSGQAGDATGYDDPPLARAVIHLGSIDDDNASPPVIIEEDDQGQAIGPANSAVVREPWSGAGVFETLARPVVWVPLLLLCALLGIYGLAGGDRGPKVSGVTASAPEQGTPGSASTAPQEEIIAGTSDNGAETEGTAATNGLSAESSKEVADATDPVSTSPPPTRVKRPEPSNDKAETEPAETEIVERPAERRVSESRAERERARRQRAGAERPRVVPGWGEPSAVTIETVLTGVPYERRRRDGTDWMTKEEDKEFRRRLKRMRRQHRDDRPY
jgi:predicted Ser/Thr protein kinase